LLLARASWLVVAVLVLGIFVVGEITYLAALQTVCLEAAEVCERQGLLTSETERELRELGLSVSFYATFDATINAVFVSAWLAVGALIFWRRSDNRMALLAAFFLITFGPVTFGPMQAVETLTDHPTLWLPIRGVQFLGDVFVALFFYTFPNGRFVPPWTRWLALASIALAAPAYLPSDSSLSMENWPEPLSFANFLFFALSFVVVQVYRYQRVSRPVERLQTKWVVFGTTVAFAGLIGLRVLAPTFSFSPDGPLITFSFFVIWATAYGFMFLIPLSIGMAMFRSRLFDIDVLINRTVVYGALSACVVGVYVAVVGYLGTLLRMDDSLFVSLVATGVVAVLFAPLRNRLQRGVNRLMYGERDEPYAVVSRLGRRLEATLAPEAVLPTVVETVKEALKLPYAAIVLEADGGPKKKIAAAAGQPVTQPLSLPLVYQNEPIGQLLLGPRAPGEAFNETDRWLLEDLARQVGIAAHAVRLTADLQRSRERLVAAREEERRRLRRDLHDGLGAQLAGLSVQTGVLRGLIPRDPSAADELVVELRDELRAAIADIRRLVYDLRPPALDDLGLIGALDRLAEQYGTQGQSLQVSIEAPEDLSTLPAAVEVAVYRIVQEALTNVVRHARAHECVVRLAVATEVKLEIVDDGIGLPAECVAGVGLSSMRERAAELGGTCAVQPTSGGGTRVSVNIPLQGKE
jgi:signal transduction histidine kinase